MNASAVIRLTKPPTINATGSTKVVDGEKRDDGEDSGSGRFADPLDDYECGDKSRGDSKVDL